MFRFHRWATQGFDFLQAIEPAFISELPEDDFLVSIVSYDINNRHAWNTIFLY